MKLIDITIDLETMSLATNAAIIQIGAVAWDRAKMIDDDAFIVSKFSKRVDLTDAVFEGFDVSESTMRWWSGVNEAVKEAVMTGPAVPVRDALKSLLAWIDGVKQQVATEKLLGSVNDVKVTLWSQGGDFDIAILKTALAKYSQQLPMSQKYLRDARTLSLEIGARILAEEHLDEKEKCCADVVADMKEYESCIYGALIKGVYKEAYEFLLPNTGDHDARYDAMKETINIKSALDYLNR